jgi:hypothetical protein
VENEHAENTWQVPHEKKNKLDGLQNKYILAKI